jgi:phenylalanyl-tRNA synthetase, beta subunit, non-spirochete bacterial
MKLSLNWLSQLIDLSDFSTKQLTDAFTLAGQKVEAVEELGGEISNVTIGRLLSVEQHPDADKLVVTTLDIGAETPIQIVTGAPNIKEEKPVGRLMPVAVAPAVLPGDFKIKKTKFRGLDSEGMLCSFEELGLTLGDAPGASEGGIWLINEAEFPCKPGDNAVDALGVRDTVIEFEVTSNRPDCNSVLGLAKEASAIFESPLTLPKTDNLSAFAGTPSIEIIVENPDVVPSYRATVVENVTVAPSPRWLREFLRGSGVRPINNIVDITNYVMLLTGHPMHAFDRREISGGKIVVRAAKKGETLLTLDGVERKLDESMTVICNAEKPMCIGGIMGGEGSGIHDDTVGVVFEAAVFNSANVRKTSKTLALRTESSARFEKGGVSCETAAFAQQMAATLVHALACGKVTEFNFGVQSKDENPHVKITLDFNWVNDFLGADIPQETQTDLLKRLGFTVNGGEITVPADRPDVTAKYDLAEEIARLYGYDKIPSAPINGSVSAKRANTQIISDKVKDALVGLGFYETFTYSFVSPKSFEKSTFKQENPLVISNPLGEDTSIMRQHLLPSLFEVAATNVKAKNKSARLFEVGTVYHKSDETSAMPASEQKKIAAVAYGTDETFFTLKAAVETLLNSLGITPEFTAKECPSFHPYVCAEITAGDKVLGKLGEVHPAVTANYEITGTKLFAFVLDFDSVFDTASFNCSYKTESVYPASSRDLALVVSDETPVGEIQNVIKQNGGRTLQNVEIFDIYRGANVDGKSVAYALTFRANDRTLTDAEIDKTIERILAACAKSGAALRS